jgi:hypothetical protein
LNCAVASWRSGPNTILPPSLKLRVVEVLQADPAAAEEPLCWRLLTTHTIANAAEVWQIVGWYQQRWIFEQLFPVMKSPGLQLGGQPACFGSRCHQGGLYRHSLTQERDGLHQRPASDVFSKPEIETLAMLIPTLGGTTQRQRNPHPPRSLAWAAWPIARLGGWNCYYKPPGPITFRRGMEQIYAIHRGRQQTCQ